MTVRDNRGNILTSNNPVLVKIWKGAGYTEVNKEEAKKPRTKRTQKTE